MNTNDLELSIKINHGSVVVKSNNKVEFPESMDLSVEELEYILEETKEFIEYKGIREKVNE